MSDGCVTINDDFWVVGTCVKCGEDFFHTPVERGGLFNMWPSEIHVTCPHCDYEYDYAVEATPADDDTLHQGEHHRD